MQAYNSNMAASLAQHYSTNRGGRRPGMQSVANYPNRSIGVKGVKSLHCLTSAANTESMDCLQRVVSERTVCYCSDFDLNAAEWFAKYKLLKDFQAGLRSRLGKCWMQNGGASLKVPQEGNLDYSKSVLKSNESLTAKYGRPPRLLVPWPVLTRLNLCRRVMARVPAPEHREDETRIACGARQPLGRHPGAATSPAARGRRSRHSGRRARLERGTGKSLKCHVITFSSAPRILHLAEPERARPKPELHK